MKVKWFNKNGSVQVPVKDKTTFRCIVAGSRSFNDYEFLKATLNLLLCIREQNHKIEIVSGGALGADKLGERWAKEKGHYIQRFVYVEMCKNKDLVRLSELLWSEKNKYWEMVKDQNWDKWKKITVAQSLYTWDNLKS